MATHLRSSLFKKAGVSTEVTLFLTTRAGYVGADNCFAPSSVCCLEWYSRNYWGAPLCINLNGRCSWEGHLQNCGEGKADFYMWEGCKLIHLGGETVTIFQNGGTMSSFHCDITETLETVCSLWVCLACDCSRDACQWCHVSGDANLVFSGCSHHWAVRQPSSPGGEVPAWVQWNRVQVSGCLNNQVMQWEAACCSWAERQSWGVPAECCPPCRLLRKMTIQPVWRWIVDNEQVLLKPSWTEVNRLQCPLIAFSKPKTFESSETSKLDLILLTLTWLVCTLSLKNKL